MTQRGDLGSSARPAEGAPRSEPATLASPLLDGSSPLDVRQRSVVQRLSVAEHASILALPSDDPLDAKRRRRVEATRPEMLAQPDALRATLERNAAALPDVTERIVARPLARALLVGAGDSLAVMSAARLAMEAALGVPCEPVQSLEAAYYLQGVDERTLVVALSSSGETTRTVEAVLVAQHAGALTVGLTNTPTSTLAQECGETLVVEATRVGWPTQSSTAALGLLLALAVEVGRRRQAPAAQPLAEALAAAPELMAAVLAGCEQDVAALATREVASRMHVFSGAGPTWAAAVIGAAKVKECTPDHALAVQLEEYHHYNSQKAGEPLWVFAPTGPSVPRAVDTAREGRRFGGQVYVLTTTGEQAFSGCADHVVELPSTHEAVSPLLYALPAQMVGYHLAMAKFAAAEASLAEVSGRG